MATPSGGRATFIQNSYKIHTKIHTNKALNTNKEDAQNSYNNSYKKATQKGEKKGATCELVKKTKAMCREVTWQVLVAAFDARKTCAGNIALHRAV